MREGVVKNTKKGPTSLMDGPRDASFQFAEKLTLLFFLFWDNLRSWKSFFKSEMKTEQEVKAFCFQDFMSYLKISWPKCLTFWVNWQLLLTTIRSYSKTMYEYLGGQRGGTKTFPFKISFLKYTGKGIWNVSVLPSLGRCQVVQTISICVNKGLKISL